MSCVRKSQMTSHGVVSVGRRSSASARRRPREPHVPTAAWTEEQVCPLLSREGQREPDTSQNSRRKDPTDPSVVRTLGVPRPQGQSVLIWKEIRYRDPIPRRRPGPQCGPAGPPCGAPRWVTETADLYLVKMCRAWPLTRRENGFHVSRLSPNLPPAERGGETAHPGSNRLNGAHRAWKHVCVFLW